MYFSQPNSREDLSSLVRERAFTLNHDSLLPLYPSNIFCMNGWLDWTQSSNQTLITNCLPSNTPQNGSLSHVLFMKPLQCCVLVIRTQHLCSAFHYYLMKPRYCLSVSYSRVDTSLYIFYSTLSRLCSCIDRRDGGGENSSVSMVSGHC